MQVNFYFYQVRQIKKRSDCPISSALDIIGDKWSLLIIRDLALSGKHTYKEFLNADEGIATNILADRLLLLEMHDLLIREEHPDSKAKAYYRLTRKGLDLIPVLVEMILWSDKYLTISVQAKSFARSLKKDKNQIIRVLQKNIL